MKKIAYNTIIDNIPASIVYEHGYNMRLVITGTFLLYVNGLVDSYDDIDILVVDAPKSFWAELLGNDYRWEVRNYGDYKSIKVVFDFATYNFISDDFYRECNNGFADCNGEIELDTIVHALKAKAKLNRAKDVEALNSIIDRVKKLSNPFQI